MRAGLVSIEVASTFGGASMSVTTHPLHEHTALRGLLLAVAVLSNAAVLGAEGSPAWREWSPGVFDEARAAGRLVLLDLRAEWCQWCRKMEATTYRDPRVLEVLGEHYIAVRADIEAEPELARRYEGYGPPATAIFDADGGELVRKRGYLRPQWMLWMLQAVAEPAPE